MPPATPQRPAASSAFPTLPGVLSSSDGDTTDAETQQLLRSRGRRVRGADYGGGGSVASRPATQASSSSSSGTSSAGAEGSASALVAASRASRNVPRTFAFNIMDGAAFSLWQQTVFQQFVYDLAHKSNAVVGYVSGVMGAAQVVAAIVGSFLADKKLPRETVMRTGSLMGFIGALLTAYGVYQESIPFLYVASLGWGGYVGLNNPAVEALFADSVATVHRTTVYTQKWMACIASYLVGYAATLILFWRVGNHWQMWEMSIVMYCGLSLHGVAFAMLWFIRDRYKLNAESSSNSAPAVETVPPPALPRGGASTMSIDENIPADTPLQAPTQMRTHCETCIANGLAADDLKSNANTSIRDGMCPTCWNGTGHHTARGEGTHHPCVGSLGAQSFRSDHSGDGDGSAAIADAATTVTVSTEPSPTTAGRPTAPAAPVAPTTPPADDGVEIIPFPRVLTTKQGIPYFICAGDFIASFGAGMTLRYFPLFFIHDYDVNPTTLTIVFAVCTVVTTFTASAMKLAAVKVFRNRVATAIACRLVGAGLMFYMAYAQDAFAKLVPMLIAFVLRMSVMNSIFGITRSVIMDHAPPSQRARWSAVESLCGFTWAGSAVVGGLIADAHGYRATFVVTGCIHTCAALVLIPAARMITDGVFKAPATPTADDESKEEKEPEAKARQRRQRKLPKKRREASARLLDATALPLTDTDGIGAEVNSSEREPLRAESDDVPKEVGSDGDDDVVLPVGSVNR